MAHIQTKNRDYRADIDGLRAVAIVSVILHHINSSILPGGFTGVDIFFVISGFLITSHLLYEINVKKDFSFKKFYIKRAKRILPPLLIMILVVISTGYFILTNFYFQSLGEQAFAAVFSYSNIYFYLTSGYFDTNSIMKPLLHTWSLGVEEQFYLVWPAILVSTLFFVKHPKHLLAIFVSLISLSLLLNSVYSKNLNALFYLMPFRIFEFSIGATVAYFLLKNNQQVGNKSTFKNILSTVAMILIISPMFYLDKNSAFPYYNALPTALGTATLIYLKNTIVSRLMSFRIFVFIGLISYSLYLYHWPIIVFIKFQFNDLSNTFFYISVLSTSLIASILSYHLVEKPFRFSKRKSISVLFVGLLTTIPIVSFAIKSKQIDNYNERRELITKTGSGRYSILNNDGCNIETIKKEKYCNWGAENQILFFGNSHNLDGYNIFHSVFGHNHNFNLIFSGNTYLCKYKYHSNGYVTSENEKCNYGAKKLTSKEFIVDIDVLVINFLNFKFMGAEFIPVVNEIRKIKPELKIVVIGGFIGLRPNYCRELINKTGNLDVCKSEKYVTYWGENDYQWIQSQSFAKNNFTYIDRIKLLCGESKELHNCETRSGRSLFIYDGDHFSSYGAQYVGKLILENYHDQLSDVFGPNVFTQIEE